MNKKVNSIIDTNNAESVIFILKGYSVEDFGGEKIKLKTVMEDPLTRMINIRSCSRRVISFDEFVYLSDSILKQYKKVVIIENPIYMNLFPIGVLLEDNIINSLLAHFDDEADEDVEIGEIKDYTDIYSNFTVTDNGLACCFNIEESLLKSEKIERIIIKTEPREISVVLKSENDYYINICNEVDYYQLLKQLETTGRDYVIEWGNYVAGREVIQSHLEYLNGISNGRLKTFAKGSVRTEPSVHYPKILEYMERYWGYSSYRTLKAYDIAELQKGNKTVISISQEKIISDLIEQVERCYNVKSFKDIFVTAPTGAGKSLMFQLPAMYIAEKYELVTLVITPLIGLMNDQVQALEAKGYYGARTINSDISPIIKQEILEEVANGKCSILYLSPESLLSRTDIEALIGSRRIGMLVIDEAHIVTTWGKQFRPDYWYLGDHVQKLRRNQKQQKERPMSFIIATFTATAIYEGNEDMYHETLNSLHMIDPITYLGYVKRENISIEIGEVEEKKNKTEYEMNKFDSLISEINISIMRNQKALIYFPTVALINRFFDYCYSKNLGDYVARYHGQMAAEAKEESFQDFLHGNRLIMLATKAFGMGIDIPDITTVLHFAPTGNVCDYMQEIGRAARDKEINGHAIYKHMNNDFQHINRLHGLSAIKPYQLVEVMKKILELYIEHISRAPKRLNKKRNMMLIDADSFSYIFEGPMSDENDLINKVKTAMLLIQKDYENRGYAPFYMRPSPVFALGYFALSDQTQRTLNAKYRGVVKVKYPELKVCEVNLRKIWETAYETKMSFPKFKYMLYSKNDDLDFNQKYSLSAAMSVDVYFADNATQIFNNVLEAVKETTQTSIVNGKYLSFTDMMDEIKKRAHISKYKVESILNIVLAAMDVYRREFAKKMYGNIYKTYYSRAGISYLFSASSRAFFTWLEHGYKYIQENTHDSHLYVVNIGDGKNTKEIITILGVLESIGVLRFKSLGGSNSQIFLYINETKTMRMVSDRPYTYKNKLLELIDYRHRESVKMLTFLFQNHLSSKQVWEYLENYFLGILPDELSTGEDLSKEDLTSMSVQFQIGDSLSDDYDDWSEANILFDSDVIASLDKMDVPLADYYNARLIIGNTTTEVYLAWMDQKLLLTSGDESKEIRDAAKKSGWTCIPMPKVTGEMLRDFFMR